VVVSNVKRGRGDIESSVLDEAFRAEKVLDILY